MALVDVPAPGEGQGLDYRRMATDMDLLIVRAWDWGLVAGPERGRERNGNRKALTRK